MKHGAMTFKPWFCFVFVSALLPALFAADKALSETKPLSMSHSLGWVRKNLPAHSGEEWDEKLDEAKWGTPSSKQALAKNWVIQLTDTQWAALVETKGKAPEEDAYFDLWVPAETSEVRGVVAISAHGSGSSLFKHPELRSIARKLDLALFCFAGNPVQRGFWPRSLLFDQLSELGGRVGHPELANAPLFLYGHSNGTGFSAIFTAGAADRVWGWVSMRPGTTLQVYQPAAATVPGLVIFGEKDSFFARPSVARNLAVIPLMRTRHNAVWNQVVEAGGGHGPSKQTWFLVFSFLRQTFAARVPTDASLATGPLQLNTLQPDSGFRGQDWDDVVGGPQALEIAPAGEFEGDAQAASWLINQAYAKDWQSFQQHGEVR